MSFYACGSGDLFLREPLPDSLEEQLTHLFEASLFSDNPLHWDIAFTLDDFDEDIVLSFLQDISPYVQAGTLTFTDEGSSAEDVWRYRYIPEQRTWLTEYGHLVFTPDCSSSPENASAGIRTDLANAFREYLEGKWASVSCEECMSSSAALISGPDFDQLQSQIENILMKWGVSYVA